MESFPDVGLTRPRWQTGDLAQSHTEGPGQAISERGHLVLIPPCSPLVVQKVSDLREKSETVT